MRNSENNKKVVPVINKNKKALSKLESLFNYRIKRVKRLKEEIEVAEGQLVTFHRLFQEKVAPVSQTICREQVMLIKALVEAFDAKILKGKKQQSKFEEVIAFFLKDLIFNKEQEGLEALYQRFAQETVEEAEANTMQAQKEQMLSMMNMMGIELSEEEAQKLFSDDLDSDLIESIEEKISEVNMLNDFWSEERHKTQKQVEREQEEAEELANISKTVKQVYKQLTRELHPDKETDEAKRREKTALMQEITEAYRHNDLFTLLSIQLAQIEGADNNLSQEKINYFNSMLLSQARELEEQKKEIAAQMSLNPKIAKRLGKKKFEDIISLLINEHKSELEDNLKHVRRQAKKVKAQNKHYIKEFVEENYEMIKYRSVFGDLMDLI